MRRVTIPCPDWDTLVGRRAVIPVKVDWPELRLTEHQLVVNAFANAYDLEPPYPDNTFFDVVIERPPRP